MTASDFYKIDWKKDKAEDPAKVYIYSTIGDWEEFGETSARTFAKDLNALEAKQIELHLNSPGGNAWDGIAIYNTLRQHDAKISVYVDGMAASAASIVAMAGDEIIMSPGSQMMIHDPSGFAFGNPATMREMAIILDKIGDSGANIYAKRAGGKPEEWRAVMQSEAWYKADEAVEAGLADRVDEDADVQVEQNFDLSRFKFQGRQKAPQPAMVARSQPTLRESGTNAPTNQPAEQPPADTRTTSPAPVAEASHKEKGASMDLAKLREAIQSSNLDDASKEAALSALAVVPGNGSPPPADAPETQSSQHQQLPAGVMALDISTVEMLKEQAAAGQEALQRLVRQERDTTIEQAIKDGKFAPARRDHWQKLWDKDPEGTKQYIDGLSPGLLPTQLIGYGQDATDADDALYAELFGTPGGAR